MSDLTRSLFLSSRSPPTSSTSLTSDPKLSRINDKAQIEELKQQLESEVGSKNKSEKLRLGLQKLVDDLSEKLEEESYQNKILSEQVQKKDSEITRLQTQFEDVQNQFETQNLTLKRKYSDVQNEMNDQIDNLHKIRHRLEKEKHLMERDLESAQMEIENNDKIKTSLEKAKKSMETSLLDLRKKYEGAMKDLQSMTLQKNQLMKDNLTLSSQLTNNLNNVSMASKVKDTLNEQLNEARAAMEELMKQSSKVYEENRNANYNFKCLETELEEEREKKAMLQNQINKLQYNLNVAQKKIQIEEKAIRPQEYDEVKKKLASRIIELETQLEGALSKCLGLEKVKLNLQAQIESMGVEIDKTHSNTNLLEKKNRQSEKFLVDSKGREAELERQLEEAKKEVRLQTSEVIRLKNDLHESTETIEGVNKENRRVMDEMHEMVEQLETQQKRVMELEKQVRRLELEKEALQNTLDESESGMLEELNRIQRLNQESACTKDEVERLMAEKDAEIHTLRKTQQRSLDELQRCLEEESRLRMQAVREKDQLQLELAEVLGIVEETTRGHEDSGKQIKKLLSKITELEKELEGERCMLQKAEKDKQLVQEKLNVQEVKTQESELEVLALERSSKTLQMELKDNSTKVERLKGMANNLIEEKKVLEVNLQNLQSDLEDKTMEYNETVQQGKKTMEEASLLAEELRAEQERAISLDRTNRTMEGKLKDMMGKLHEAEASAMQGGHKVVQGLERRIHELEMQLEDEQHHHSESVKALKRQERRLREVTNSCQQSASDHQQLQDSVDKLQHKLKAYKRQIDELEEACKVNMTRYKKTQQEMEHAVERASIAESSLYNLKAGRNSSRCSSVAPAAESNESKLQRLSRASSEVKQISSSFEF